MIQLVYCFMIVVLGYIAVQDFRYRAVYWFLFPCFLILIICKYLLIDSFSFINLIVNLSLLLIQLFTLSIWLFLRYKVWYPVKAGFIGLGDILFFVLLAVSLPPVSFLAFQLISMVIILTIFLIIYGKREVNKGIPLAGCQALLLIPVLLFELIISADFVDLETVLNHFLAYNLYGL